MPYNFILCIKLLSISCPLNSNRGKEIVKRRNCSRRFDIYGNIHARGNSFRDDTHMTSMKIAQFSMPLTPLVHLRPKFFHSRDHGRPVSNKPPLQTITNQLKENIIQRGLRDASFRSAFFRYQYQLINIVWLYFELFSFSWSLPICFFVALYLSVWSCSKIPRKNET